MGAGYALYIEGAGIIIGMSFLTICVAVLGCCGAQKESRVMLTSFSVILLLQFIIMVVGAVVVNNGSLSSEIEKEMNKSLSYYNDQPDQDTPSSAYKTIWNEFQKDFQCCGVVSVKDWSLPGNDYHFQTGINKPEGCCKMFRNGTQIPTNGTQMTTEETCRKASADPSSTDYNFKGCFTGMMKRVAKHRSAMVTIGVLTLLFMFINIAGSFSLCMMLTGEV